MHLGVVRHLRGQGVLNPLEEPVAVVLVLGLERQGLPLGDV